MKKALLQWLHRHLPTSWFDNRLFVFAVVGGFLGLCVILLAPFSGSGMVIVTNLITGVIMIAVSVGGLLGWPLRPLVYLMLAVASAPP